MGPVVVSSLGYPRILYLIDQVKVSIGIKSMPCQHFEKLTSDKRIQIS